MCMSLLIMFRLVGCGRTRGGLSGRSLRLGTLQHLCRLKGVDHGPAPALERLATEERGADVVGVAAGQRLFNSRARALPAAVDTLSSVGTGSERDPAVGAYHGEGNEVGYGDSRLLLYLSLEIRGNGEICSFWIPRLMLEGCAQNCNISHAILNRRRSFDALPLCPR